ncbi:precorrin-2 C(20)-methyltransferase [Oligoflexus tunisiensis]|uniref:precorrin-2 C(20)-methyltransferase n=1 Tax=Oligoflexus tunisiensis TaxID=708132 RepID=UPI00114CADA5|nr:precorrin-2 C(20)-methyltransferase [Oligoflexus tunisiensis]
MKTGRLIGIGLGPGASDLITLRALRHLQTLPVLAIPRPNPWTPSLAFRIIKEHLPTGTGQQHLFLEFPMSRDPEILLPAWNKAFAAIREKLDAGLDVGFVTQGDPFVFSTFIYVYESLKVDIPDLEVEMVPGVSSINAVPNVAGRPLVDGQERLAVIPATYGIEDLRNILRSFDSVVLMKVSSIMPQIVQVLEHEGLLEASVYVERATTDEQRIVHDLRRIRNDRCVYFSMVVVTKKHRNGILRGEAPKIEKETLHVT